MRAPAGVQEVRRPYREDSMNQESWVDPWQGHPLVVAAVAAVVVGLLTLAFVMLRLAERGRRGGRR